jgi:hypothetical protein
VTSSEVPVAYKKKPHEEHIGHAHNSVLDLGPVTKGKTKRHDIPVIPTAAEHWGRQARSWYNSLALSGQSAYFEASDWATAVCAAEVYDVFFRTYNAGVLSHFTKLSERLCSTIIDRKRIRIELTDPPRDRDEEAADDTIREWHRRLHIVPDPD